MNGLGRANYINMVYEGQFHNNQWHGYGRVIMNDGSYYTGYFRNDRKHGEGKLVKPVKNKKSPEYGKLQVDIGEWSNDSIKHIVSTEYIETDAQTEKYDTNLISSGF